MILNGIDKKNKIIKNTTSYRSLFIFLQVVIVYSNFLREFSGSSIFIVFLVSLPFSSSLHLGCFQFLSIIKATVMSIYKHSLLLHP